MRSTALLLSATLLVTPLAVSAQTAGAASAAELRAAGKKFREAQKQYEQKQYAAALELAREALEVSGSPNARLYVARSLRELGRHAEAYEEMSLTLREASEMAQSEAKYAPTRDAAAAELALLQRKVGRVIIALADPPPGARVELNDERVAGERLGHPIAVMPGEIVVVATAEGAATIERKLVLAAGETRTLALAFSDSSRHASGEPPPAVGVEPATRDEPAPSGGALRTVGFVTVGVGVAGLAAFGIAGFMAKSEFDRLESECGSQRCGDAKYADNVDRGKRLETVANIGLIVGAVGLLAGGTMILFGGPKQKEGAELVVSPGGFELGYRGRF
jgi:hypothetical protein